MKRKWWFGIAASTTVTAILLFLWLVLSVRSVAPEPAGPWSVAKTGSWLNVKWTLFATKPNGGGRCLTLETEPPLEGSHAIPESELYRGKLESCAPSPGTGRFKYVSLYLASEIPSGDFNYLFGETADGIDKVVATFGTDAPRAEFVSDEQVDTADGLVVVLYEKRSTLLTLQPIEGDRVKEVCPTRARRAIVRLEYC